MATTQERPDQQLQTSTEEGQEKFRSLGQDVWRQFKRHKGALAGLIILTVIVLATVLGPIFYPQDPFALDIPNANSGPSADHPFGTDNLGRDVLARVMASCPVSSVVSMDRS